MKIIVACKVVPDDQDIQVQSDGSLDMSKAHQVVSTYDLNAIEAAAQLASEQDGSQVIAVSVGASAIDESKLKKNILARGVDELHMIADDSCDGLDAHASAEALSELIGKIGDYSLVICGDGSADNFAQQVDIQLACALGLPVVNGVTKITVHGGVVQVERSLEDDIETLEVDLPAVISVAPDIALPRIPGMKDILAAGKKPMEVSGAANSYANTIEVIGCKAPEQADRKLEIMEASEDGAIEKFAQAIKAAQ